MEAGPPLVPIPTGSNSRSHSREPSLPGSFPPFESAHPNTSDPPVLAPTPIRPAVALAFTPSSPSSPPTPSIRPPVLGKETHQQDRSSTPTSLPPPLPAPTSLTRNPSARKAIPTMMEPTTDIPSNGNLNRRASITSSSEIKAIGVAAGRNLSSSFPAPPNSALPAIPASTVGAGEIGSAPFPTSDMEAQTRSLGSSLAANDLQGHIEISKYGEQVVRGSKQVRGGIDRSGNAFAAAGLGSPLNLSRGPMEERRSPQPLSPPPGNGTRVITSSKPPLAGVAIASRQRERTSSTGSQSSTSKDLMLSKLAEALKTERGKSAMYEREILAAEEEVSGLRLEGSGEVTKTFLFLGQIDEIGRNLKVVTQKYVQIYLEVYYILDVADRYLYVVTAINRLYKSKNRLSRHSAPKSDKSNKNYNQPTNSTRERLKNTCRFSESFLLRTSTRVIDLRGRTVSFPHKHLKGRTRRRNICPPLLLRLRLPRAIHSSIYSTALVLALDQDLVLPSLLL